MDGRTLDETNRCYHELEVELLAKEEEHQEELQTVKMQALEKINAAQAETLNVSRQLNELQSVHTRSQQAAAAVINGLRDEMETLRSVNEEIGRVREQMVAQNARHQEEKAELRLDAAADVVNIKNAAAQEKAAIHAEAARQQAELQHQHATALRNQEEQMVAQNARHLEEIAQLRLDAAADVVKIRNAAEQEKAAIHAEATRKQAELQDQHATALRNKEEEVRRLREENAHLHRRIRNQRNDAVVYIPVDERQPQVMVDLDQYENLERRVRELEAGQRLYRVGPAVLVDINDIQGDARQRLDESLRNGENARTVMDLQDDNTDRRAIVGSCGHSICWKCSNPEKSCPLCGRPEAFANGTVNYQALHLLEYYMNNAFDVFRKWWETVETGIGMCSKCMSTKTLRLCITCQKAQNWKDVNMQSQALCEQCADHRMKIAANHKCDFICIKEKFEGTPDIKCCKCSITTQNPQLCSACFHMSTDHINVDTFSLCADCILDHHSGHETSKATKNYSIRLFTVTIIGKVLLEKLRITEKEDEKKCKVRQMRMEVTGQEVICRASTHYPLWTEEDCTDPKLLGRPKIPKNYIQSVLSSVEKQYDFLQKMTEPCPCVAVWEDVKRLNIFDIHGFPPHFKAMVSKPNWEKVLDRCPLELEENEEWKDQLMEVIERGEVLTEPHADIYRFYGNQELDPIQF